MIEFKKYKDFLMEDIIDKKISKPFYRMVLSDIQIFVPEIINALKTKFHFGCWYTYNNDLSVTLEYFRSSDDSDENIERMNDFLNKELPYFKEIKIHRDDKRIILKFIEVGDPVRFRFYY